MVLPKQTITVLDPGLGLVQVASDAPFYSGVSSAGPVDTLLSFSSIPDVRSTLGYGDLPEWVGKALRERGGPVLAMRRTGGTAGTSNPTVTQTGTGPAITVAGTATMSIIARVEITKGGALGAAEFRYSLDALNALDPSTTIPTTWSQTRIVPSGGTFVLPNTGFTLTFAAGTYVVGTTYDFTGASARFNAADITAVGTALAGYPSVLFPLWVVTSPPLSAADAFSVAAALGGSLTTLAGGFRFARGIADAGSFDTAANILTQAASFSDKRVSLWAGTHAVQSVLPFEGYSNYWSPCGASAAARAARELISTDLARYASGSLAGVLAIDFDGYQDQTLDGAGISTLRTWPGVPGFYIANGRLKAPPGSDFQYLQYGRIMDRACRAVYEAMLPFISEGFRTVAGTGTIDPLDAADVTAAGQAALNAALLEPNNARGTPGHVSLARFSVDMTNNLATTGVLKTRVAMLPLGYAREINQELGFTLNP